MLVFVKQVSVDIYALCNIVGSNKMDISIGICKMDNNVGI